VISARDTAHDSDSTWFEVSTRCDASDDSGQERLEAGAVRAGTIHFGRVLAREAAATVACISTVSVDNDLAPGEPRICHRTPHDKPAGGVDKRAHPFASKLGGNDGFDHMLRDV